MAYPFRLVLDDFCHSHLPLKSTGMLILLFLLENVWQCFAQAEKLWAAAKDNVGDCGNLRVRDAHDSVLDAAACPAHPALETSHLHFTGFTIWSSQTPGTKQAKPVLPNTMASVS